MGEESVEGGGRENVETFASEKATGGRDGW
jgi:hypothetical protein